MKPLWPREKALEWVKLHKMVAIIRARNVVQARGVVEAVAKGGFKLIEVAMTVLGAMDLIREFSKRPGLLVGAGSVLSEKMAQDALNAGAQFLTTPQADPAILKLAKRSKILCCAGALTPTEVVRTWKEGADIVRLFPVSVLGGPRYVETLREILPDIPLLAAGGVTLENLRDTFLSGATAVEATDSLMSEKAVENSQWGDITAQCRRFQEVLQHL